MVRNAVRLTLAWHDLAEIDRLVCAVLNTMQERPGIDRTKFATYLRLHETFEACLIDGRCIHCATAPSNRRNRLCDACEAVRRRTGRLPTEAQLDRRNDRRNR